MRWRLFPWAPRSERRRHVEQARAGAAASRREADKAVRLERDLRRIVEENHFAAAFVEQVITRHGGDTR